MVIVILQLISKKQISLEGKYNLNLHPTFALEVGCLTLFTGVMRRIHFYNLFMGIYKVRY